MMTWLGFSVLLVASGTAVLAAVYVSHRRNR